MNALPGDDDGGQPAGGERRTASASAASASAAPASSAPAAIPGGVTPSVPMPPSAPAPAPAPALAKWLLLYTVLRFGTLLVLTAALSFLMPLILALLFAVVLALPLSWVVFGSVRRRVNEAMATASAHRRAERDRLRAALDGRAG